MTTVNLAMQSESYTSSTYGSALSAGRGLGEVLAAIGAHFTFEVLVRGTSSGSTKVILGQSNAFWLGVDSSDHVTLHYGLSATEVTVSTSASINDGSDHWLRCSVGPSGGKVWVDGVVAGSSATSAATAGVVTSVVAPGYPTNGLGVRTLNGAGTSFDWPGTIDQVALFNVETTSGNYTPALVSGVTANLANLWNLNGDGLDETGVLVLFAATNAGMYFSPYNWDALASGTYSAAQDCKQTTACGAYIDTIVTGTGAISLGLDGTVLSGFGANAPIVAWSVDGAVRQTAKLTVGATQLALASGLTSGSSYSVRVWLLGANELTGTRYGTSSVSPTNVLRVTGFYSDSTSVFSAPTLRSNNAIVFGDSITEGVRSAGTTTEPEDHARSYAWFMRDALDAELGVIGYGGQGWTTTGSGSMATFVDAWDHLDFNHTRSFSTVPEFVFVNHGTNGTTTASDVTAWLGDARAAFGTDTWVFVITPVGGFAAAALATGVSDYLTANPSDARTVLLDLSTRIPTTGFESFSGINLVTTDGIHPYEVTHANIAAAVVALAKEAMVVSVAEPSFGTFGAGRL